MSYLYCLLDTDGLTVHYDMATQCLYNTWKGTHSETSIQENTGLIASCLRAHPCCRVLSDHQQLCGAWTGDPALVATTLKRMARLGVQRFAWVPSACHSLDRAAMEAARHSTTPLCVGIFASIHDAAAWLCQV